MKYRPEIDGLRAIAVVSVILYHANVGPLHGGYLGVDVFFVISGYLITNVLVHDLSENNFSFAEFYERRARRLMPALFFICFVTTVLSFFFLTPQDFGIYSESLVSVLLFGSNIYFWITQNYFSANAELHPLLHTWSLAVEEQFYLFYPIFLLVIWRVGKNLFLPFVFIGFLLSLSSTHFANKAAFYLLPFRAWELLTGAACAYVLARMEPSKRTGIIGTLGLAAIFVSFLIYDHDTPTPSFWTLLPVLGTGLAITFIHDDSLSYRFLTISPMVGIGLVSYSAYLWHQPIFSLIRHNHIGHPPIWVMILAASLSIVFAYLTWRFIEQPFRKRKVSERNFAGTATVLVTTGSLTALFSAVTVMIMFNPKTVERAWLATKSEAVGASYQQMKGVRAETADWRPLNNTIVRNPCHFRTQELDEADLDNIRNCADRHGQGVLLIGDSHGIDMYGMISSRFEPTFFVGITTPLCRAHSSERDCQYDDIEKLLRSEPDLFRAVFYHQAGFYLLNDISGKPGSRSMFERLNLIEPSPDFAPDKSRIELVSRYLKSIADLERVIWLGPRIEPHIPQKAILHKGCEFEWALRPNLTSVFKNLDESIAIEMGKDRSVEYISSIEWMNFNVVADFMTCDTLYWADGDHLTAEGEVLFGKRLPSELLAQTSTN